MPFPVRKELKLDFLGAGWAGAYLAFSSLTFTETRGFSKLKIDESNPDSEENMDFVLNLLSEHFLEGMGFNGDELVALAATDLPELPPDVITKSIELLVGGDNSAPLVKN